MHNSSQMTTSCQRTILWQIIILYCHPRWCCAVICLLRACWFMPEKRINVHTWFEMLFHVITVQQPIHIWASSFTISLPLKDKAAQSELSYCTILLNILLVWGEHQIWGISIFSGQLLCYSTKYSSFMLYTFAILIYTPYRDRFQCQPTKFNILKVCFRHRWFRHVASNCCGMKSWCGASVRLPAVMVIATIKINCFALW